MIILIFICDHFSMWKVIWNVLEQLNKSLIFSFKLHFEREDLKRDVRKRKDNDKGGESFEIDK
jgi:hypothetical protein